MSKMLTIDISDSDKSKRMIKFLNNHISIQSNSYNNFYNSQIINEENNKSIEKKFLPNEINKIGEGGFGTVYKSEYNILVAKKIINKENEDVYKNEIKYLDLLNKSEVRNNVVHYYNSELDKNFDNYVIYLELCDGNLKDFREKIIKKNNGSFPLYYIQDIMKQINKVMEYLIIKKRLCYNYMKPENILYKIIDEENDLYEFKLCDFCLVEEKISKNDIANSVSGTINYMEEDKKNYYEKGIRLYDQELSELYDLGNVMHYLFFGEKYDKNNENFDEKIYNIKDQDFQFILKNTLTHDIQKIPVDEYFKADFFKKDRKDLIDGINNNKIFKLSKEDAIEIAKNISKIKNAN
jgi:serine/threonine protein kinase